jgi:Flp pilus assembly protein CpaB
VVRLTAAVLLGLAAWLTVRAVTPAPADPGLPTLVAVHELPLGATVGADDVRLEARPEGVRPAGALDRADAAIGHVVSGPVLVGEMITTARFRGAAQLAGLSPGLVAVSLPLDDAGLLATLGPAMSVSVLAAGSGDPLATEARVLSADGAGSGRGAESGMGALAAAAGGVGRLVVAVTPAEARAIAAAMGARGAGDGFVVAVRG